MNTTEQKAALLGELLLKNNWHVSCAESCTGGGIAYAITSVSGSSAWFEKSWVTYANDAKTQLLDVSEAILTQHGAVSEQTANEMVTGVKKQSAADICIAVTGIAGPTGGSVEKPVGLVWFGFYLNDQIVTIAQQFMGDRQSIREQAITFALSYVIEYIEKM